jgi:hypothetical protein
MLMCPKTVTIAQDFVTTVVDVSFIGVAGFAVDATYENYPLPRPSGSATSFGDTTNGGYGGEKGK